MNDNGHTGLELVLMTLFGGAGLVLLVAGFVLPYMASDRVLAVIGAALGIGFAVFQGVRLRRSHRRDDAAVPVEAPAGEPR
jgi:hypothetical protein